MANDIRISIGLDGVPGVQSGAAQAGKAIEGIGKAGQVSAAQTAAALRTLPAQFTDIATALQGGQSPLTVLLQQGGQIKDAFGGIAPAVRALGGYVAGLVGPVTIAGGAVAAMAVAYAKGSAEADAYARALILSGNAAGTTAGRLQDAAKRIDSVVGTQGAAAAALAQFAAASNIDPSGLERFATAALQMERATGTAIDKTIEHFESLGKSPLESVAKLNESTNFLTESVYRQIKALSEAGRTTEAAAVAQNAYADALTQRSAQIEDRLGSFERGWRSVKSAAKEAWDAMLNVGRPDTLQDQLDAAQQRLDELRGKNPFKNAGLAEAVQAAVGGDAFLRSRISDQEQVVASLQEQARLEGRSATAAGEAARQVRARIEFDRTRIQYLSESAKLEREITQAREQGRAAGASPAEIDQLIANIRAKAPKPKDGADPFAADRDAARAWADAWQDFVRIGAEAQAKTDGLTKGQARLVEYLQSSAYATEAKSEADRQLVVQQALTAISAEQLAEREEADAKALKALTDERERAVRALESSASGVEQAAQKLEDENAAAALAAAQNITLAQAIERVTVARLREAQARAMSFGDDDAAAAIQREIDARARLAEAMDSKEARKAADKLREDQVKDWAKVWDQVGQSLTDALMDGGRSASRMLKDLFRTLVLRPLLQPVIGGASAAVGSLLGMPASASTGAGDAGGSGLSLGGVQQLAGYAQMAGTFGSFAQTGFVSAGVNGAGTTFGAAQSLYASGNTAGAAGMGAGAAAAYGAGIMAGRSLGQGIGNGYSAIGGGSGNTAVNAGVIIGTIFGGPIGAVIGGAIGGVINRAFGTKTVGSGIQGTFGGEAGFSGAAYEDIKGGWFRGDKTRLSAIDADTAQSLSGAVSMTRELTKDYAAALGLASASVDGYTQAVKISLRGLDAKQQQEAITNALSGFADGLATGLGGGLDAVAVKGETSGQTLARLASDLTTVNRTLSAFSDNLLSVGVAGANAASKLIEAFGGAQAYASSTTSYFDAFYSSSERASATTRELTKALGSLGFTLPDSRAQFRSLVDAQDLTTDAGRKTYAALLGLSSAFASISEQAQSAALSTTGLAAEIERLRGSRADSGTAALAELQAQFATRTAQARSGSQSAIDALPSLSKAIEESSLASARTAVDIATMRAYLAGSLSDTLALSGGLSASATIAASNATIEATAPAQARAETGPGANADALLRELQALHAELAALRAEQQVQAAAIASNTGKTARTLERVTPDGDAFATRAAP